MLIKKKGEKPLRYKNEWFVSELILNGKTYYSRDGFGFNHSRHDRIRMEDLVGNSCFGSIHILSIEDENGTVMSLGSIYSHISISIENRILTLNAKAK